MADDGFVELVPTSGKGSEKAACTLRCITAGRHTAKRLSITLRLDNVDQDVEQVLVKGLRFSVAYNQTQRALRIKSDVSGRYEAQPAPKTNGRVVYFRVPLPAQIPFVRFKAHAASIDGNSEQGIVLIDVPGAMFSGTETLPDPAPPSKRTVPPAVRKATVDNTAAIMGDPPPGRSALDQRGS